MLIAAVDQEQIRQRHEFFIAVDIVLQPSGDHLIHAGIVVRLLQSADAEFAVSALERLSVHMYGHRRDDACVAEVRYIECLDPRRELFESKRFLQPFKRFASSLRLGRAAKDLFLCVESRAFDQPHPLAALRHLDDCLSSCALTEEGLQFLPVLAFDRQQDMLRHGAARRIILTHEVRDRLGVVLKRLVDHLRVLAAHIAAAKMQHGKAALRAAAKADRVGIRKSRRDHALLARQRIDGANAVTQSGRLLKAQLLRRRLHLFRERRDQLVALSLKDQRRLVHARAVILLGHARQTPARAAAHLIFQAGSLLADVARKAA